MKIQTLNGIKEVKVIKYFEVNGRKLAIHRAYVNDGFTNYFFSATDYLTGYAVEYDETVHLVLIRAKLILSKHSDFDYSKYEIINN